jgi:hypothetical protein
LNKARVSTSFEVGSRELRDDVVGVERKGGRRGEMEYGI